MLSQFLLFNQKSLDLICSKAEYSEFVERIYQKLLNWRSKDVAAPNMISYLEKIPLNKLDAIHLCIVFGNVKALSMLQKCGARLTSYRSNVRCQTVNNKRQDRKVSVCSC